MSDPAKKPGRFGSTFKGVAGALPPKVEEQPAPPPRADEDAWEPYSTSLTRRTKKLLKQATAEERRKQFEVVEQAVTEYLEKNHPRLLRE